MGGGIAADAAVTGIREIDPKGLIGLLSEERDPPYLRPLLSEGLWAGRPLGSIWRHTECRHATLSLERKIVSSNAKEQTARDDQESKSHGEMILLATGGTPRRLPLDGERIHYYLMLEGYRHRVSMTEGGRDRAAIGGGFIGAEIAAALVVNTKNVTMLFPEDGIGAPLSSWSLPVPQ